MPPVPSPDAVLALVTRYQAGDRRAGDELLAANEGLICKHARAALPWAGSLAFEDLVQEGRLGLLVAARKFDCTRGLRFITYATWWVRQGIHRAIETQGAMIRIPTWQHLRQQKARSARARLQQRGADPGPEEIAEEAGLSLEQLRHLDTIPGEVFSLDYGAAGDGGTLGELLPDVGADPAEVAVDQVFCSRLLAITALSERERLVILGLFGFIDGQPWTLDQTAQALGGYSREGVRHVTKRALAKLRMAAGVVGETEAAGPRPCPVLR